MRGVCRAFFMRLPRLYDYDRMRMTWRVAMLGIRNP